VLSADGKERRKGLESRLHQEEGRSERSAYDTRCRPGEDIDPERLNVRVLVYRGRQTLAQRLIETETTAIQQNLVDILSPNQHRVQEVSTSAGATTYGGANASEQPAGSFILQDDLDAVEDTPIFLDRLGLCLQLSLQL